MDTPRIPADEQLTVAYGSESWALFGPDGRPVFEARPGAMYYHRLFGRWRDLPPGDRLSVDGVQSVEVRWDGGWAVGVALAPHGLWRRLVRWDHSRDLPKADDAARALSVLIGRPLRAESLGQQPALTRIRFDSPAGEVALEATPEVTPEPAPQSPPRSARVRSAPAAPPLEPARTVTPRTRIVRSAAPEPSIALVEDATDVRLPLRLGGGTTLAYDNGRLVLTLPGADAPGGGVLIVLGLAVLALLVVIVISLRGGVPNVNPLLMVTGFGALLIGVGLAGMWLLLRWTRAQGEPVIFDRDTLAVTLPDSLRSEFDPQPIPLEAVHGVRIQGRALPQRATLAYHRVVALMLDRGNVPLIQETRATGVPADPADMPSLEALRQRADEQAGPSLARAGARVIAWYLGVPLADE